MFLQSPILVDDEKIFGYKMRLISVNAAINVALDAKNPLAAHDIHGRMRINQGPSAILQESIKSSVMASLQTQCLTAVEKQVGSQSMESKEHEGQEAEDI